MSYPFVKAHPSNYKAVPLGRSIDLWVVHDGETPEGADSAEGMARYFAVDHGAPSSAHYSVDSDSVVQSVRDHDVAYAAPGANHNGLHCEHAGRARQSRAEWLDRYGRKMLDRSARLAAEKAKRYGLPLVRLSASDLVAGRRGFTGHRDVTAAFHQSTHTDPGPAFPWDWYLARVRYHAGAVSVQDVQEAHDQDPHGLTGSHPRQTRAVQRALGMRVRSGRWRKGTRERYAKRYPSTKGRPTRATLTDLAAGAFPVVD